MERKEINAQAKDVMLRIGVFVAYYILMQLLCIVAVLGLIGVIYFYIVNILPMMFNRLGFLILFLLLFAAYYLIKILYKFIRSPFVKNENTKNNRVEIHENEYPELFAMINDVANQAECKMPKHVYLSPDVNACIFYNARFWNIFIPVEKQLEIGVGLMDDMNKDELKSVISHEFGHYSQKTSRLNSTIYVTICILSNLCESLTGWSYKLTSKVFAFVLRGNLRFSRQLEYDADTVAANIVGEQTFISSLCKVSVIANRHLHYDNFLKNLNEEQKDIENYWEGYNVAKPTLVMIDCVSIDEKTIISSPINQMNTIPSCINVNNIWSTHPSDEDRIKNIKKLSLNVPNGSNLAKAKTLVDDGILEKLNSIKKKELKVEIDKNVTLSIISYDDFDKWIQKKYIENYLPISMQPFFNREFVTFALPNDRNEIVDNNVNPFNFENSEIVKKYQGALNDLHILHQLRSKEIDAKEFRYNGIVYKVKSEELSLLIKKQQKICDNMLPQVASVDKSIFAYLATKVENYDQLKLNYKISAYINNVFPSINTMINRHIVLILSIQSLPDRLDESTMKELMEAVTDFRLVVNRVIKKISVEYLRLVADESVITKIVNMKVSTDINKQIRDLSSVVSLIKVTHTNLSEMANNYLIKTLRDYVPESIQNQLKEQFLQNENTIVKSFENYVADEQEKVDWKEKICAFLLLFLMIGLFVGLVFTFKWIVGILYLLFH